MNDSAMNSKGFSVCFGYRTALEMHAIRSCDPVMVEFLTSSRSQRLPMALPSASERAAIMQALSEDCLTDRLSSPLDIVLAAKSHGFHPNGWRYHYATDGFVDPGMATMPGIAKLLSVPSAFCQLAAKVTLIELIELGYELCGTYRSILVKGDTCYGVAPLTSVRKLTTYAQKHREIKGSSKALHALKYVRDLSASPLETKAAMLFGLPAGMGGYALGMPQMNAELPCSSEARRLTGKSVLRCDLYWRDAGLDVEIQSARFHHGELKRVQDSRRTNALKVMGVEVILLSSDELMSMAATDAVAITLWRASKKRFRTERKDYRERKAALRKALKMPIEHEIAYPVSIR